MLIVPTKCYDGGLCLLCIIISVCNDRLPLMLGCAILKEWKAKPTILNASHIETFQFVTNACQTLQTLLYYKSGGKATNSLFFDLIIMQIMFHCDLDIVDYINDLKNCKIISNTLKDNFELDLVLEIDPEINDKYDFDEFTEYFGIPYDLVNCIEAHDFCAV